MRVSISVEFDVDDEDDEDVAVAAAEEAAHQYLAFCTSIGMTSGRDFIEVHVEGHGHRVVRIAD